MWKPTWMLVLAAVLCGCFKTKDELTINADGSGVVRLETRLLVPPETIQGLGMSMGAREGPLICPPTSQAEAKRWFPGKDFKLTAREDRAEDGGTILVITAEFKDVNALLASPYAKAHGLTLVVTNGTLSLKAITGIEAAAWIAEMKDEGGMFRNMMVSLEDVAKKKNEMRTEFRVTLPNAVSSANERATRDGKSATWSLDRASQTNAVEFAQQAGAVLEAACSAEGVKFSPVTPLRLNLLAFKDAPAAGIGDKVTAPDNNKIATAAKFVPLALQVTRSIDLSGEGGSAENRAILVGTVVLPREFAPQKWGAVKLDEVVDEKGKNLKFEENNEASVMARHSAMTRDLDAGDNEGDEAEKDEGAKRAEARHTVALNFQPPEWKAREIARVKGSIPLHYFGGAKVVKLSNAIPEKWIRVMKNERDFDFDSSEKSINDPALPEEGLSLRVAMCVAQGPILSMMIQGGGGKMSVTDGQVYDAAGRPWPTMFQSRELGEEGSFGLMVAGRPKGPLSLALVVTGIGASVDVPILVERVPLQAR